MASFTDYSCAEWILYIQAKSKTLNHTLHKSTFERMNDILIIFAEELSHSLH